MLFCHIEYSGLFLIWKSFSHASSLRGQFAQVQISVEKVLQQMNVCLHIPHVYESSAV